MRRLPRLRPPARAGLLVVILASISGYAAAGAGLEVRLRVVEPAGIARHAAPVTVGVPFPRGTLQDPGSVRVAGPRGEPAAVQSEVLERWPDGSVRWLLVDFLADVGANGEAGYALRRDGAPPPAGPRVRLADAGSGRRLDTGALRLTVPVDGRALAIDVEREGRRVASELPLPALVLAGAALPRAVAETPRVETAGPVRSELLLRGRWPNGAAYEARLAAFAGLPLLRLRYTLAHGGSARALPIQRLGIAAPGAFSAGTLGLEGGARRFAPLEDAHELRQSGFLDATLDGASSAPADCWGAGAGRAGTAMLVSPWCRQSHPQVFAVARTAVRVDLFAGGKEPVELGRGAARTHEVWFAFGSPDEVQALAELAGALAAPLIAHVDPGWVVASGALPQSLAPPDDGAASFLRRLADAFRRYRARASAERWDDGPPVDCDRRDRERPRTGFYGVLNWGDWNFPGYRDRTKGCDAWGNLEYDLPQVLGLGWVATGTPAMWDAFQAAALHYRDVDIIHHDPDHPDRVGLNHPHKVGHFAPEAVQSVDLGHAWLEGLITHYRLTGERRSLDAARAMGDALAERRGKAGNPRQFGWPMIALAALAQATGDARYREAAVRFAAPALGAYPPTPAAGDWKIGILADGLAAVEAVAPDAERLAWLRSYADALVAAPPERFEDARYALPLGALAAATGEAGYRERALAVAAGLKIGDWGKTLALGGRTGFRLLGPLAATPPQAGVTPDRGAPRRRSAGAPRPR